MAGFVVWIVVVGIGAVLLGIAAVWLLRRTKLAEGSEGGPGRAIGAAGTLFNALFLISFTLSVVLAWQAYDHAQNHVRDESAALTKLESAVSTLPDGDQLRAQVREHVRLLIDNEWPRLAGGHGDPDADRRLARISTAIMTIQPADAAVASARTQAMRFVETAADARDSRLHDATTGLPSILLGSVMLTAFVLLAHTVIVGLPHSVLSMPPLLTETALIAMALFVLILVQRPYHGALTIEPDQLRQALATFTTTSS